MATKFTFSLLKVRKYQAYHPCQTFKSSILSFFYLLSWGEGSNSSNYTASEWGASLADVNLSWLANTAHSSQRLSNSSNHSSRTGSGLTTRVVTIRAPHTYMTKTL